jgi:hypothetical protein
VFNSICARLTPLGADVFKPQIVVDERRGQKSTDRGLRKKVIRHDTRVKDARKTSVSTNFAIDSGQSKKRPPTSTSTSVSPLSPRILVSKEVSMVLDLHKINGLPNPKIFLKDSRDPSSEGWKPPQSHAGFSSSEFEQER